MYLVSLFGFSFAILSMAEMSSMCVVVDGARVFINFTDSYQGSYIRRTVSVSEITCRIAADLRTIVPKDSNICV